MIRVDECRFNQKHFFRILTLPNRRALSRVYWMNNLCVIICRLYCRLFLKCCRNDCRERASFFQVHLNACKARNFDFMVQKRQTCENASFFATKTIKGIDLMFCLSPHEQAEKLSMMNLDQKRPFLFPCVLTQMEGMILSNPF